MSVTVKLKYLRHSPRKLRAVTALFKGKTVETALNTTAVMPQSSAGFLNKLLKMAVAAAKQKEFDPDKMIIASVRAEDGPKIKRVRASARGHRSRYNKHLAHLAVTIEEPKTEMPIKKSKIIKKERKNGTEN